MILESRKAVLHAIFSVYNLKLVSSVISLARSCVLTKRQTRESDYLLLFLIIA